MIDEDLLSAVVDSLGGRTIATAESCTAGRVAAVLASAESAVEFFRGGLVAYQTSVKRELLGVSAVSVLSETAAREMAAGACSLLGADVAVSTTGLAGPDAEDGVAPGTVFIGVSIDGRTSATTVVLDGSPAEICEQASGHALRIVHARLSRVTS